MQRTIHFKDLFRWAEHPEDEIQKSNLKLCSMKLVIVYDILLIVGLAFILGVMFNFANPHGLDLINVAWFTKPFTKLDVSEAKLKYDAGVVFVDARSNEYYRHKHIKGAVNLPANLFDFTYKMKFGQVELEKELVVYGRDFSRLYDENVASKLSSRGYLNIKILPGGLSEWEEKAYPCVP